MKYLVILNFISIGFAQRIQLFTKTDDIFTLQIVFLLKIEK